MRRSAFVVLRHEDAQGIHHDLMIDAGEHLATWKAEAPPDIEWATGWRCRRMGQHRRRYLDYEGPISGGRGRVTRHDQGNCVVHRESEERWELTFHGQRLTGDAVLRRHADESWTLRREHLRTSAEREPSGGEPAQSG